jgi:pyruvate,water dikinase
MLGFVVPVGELDAADVDRVGPKAANLAALARAGLPTPDGFCITAQAYRAQITALGLDGAVQEFAAANPSTARRLSVDIRLGLHQGPMVPAVLDPLLDLWHEQRRRDGRPAAVRSSALVEDREGASFAGQFESFLGLTEAAALLTAVRACWAALWTGNACRYMENHGLKPSDTAMAILIQPLVAARVAGGGLSRTADDRMLISAAWGLGSTIAQGEVVPDRIELTRQGFLRNIHPGRKHHRETCAHANGSRPQAVPDELVAAPCLEPGQAVALGRLLKKAEDVIGRPVEIEWALDDCGFTLLQARPLHFGPAVAPDEIWLRHPGLTGHPGGIGWGCGRAVIINCECELARVEHGDVLVTKIAGPALSQVLPRIAGLVAERGGSTSHLASLGRERGIPMVLGVLDATRRIPEGSRVAVDGVAGIVRWIR